MRTGRQVCLERWKAPWLAAGLGLVSVMASGAEEATATVRISESWSNVFGGSETNLHLVVSAREAVNGRVGWRLAHGDRTLRRGEAAVTAGPGRDATIGVRLTVPEVKEGVVLRTAFSVFVVPSKGDEPLARFERTIWVFGRDPFAHRKQWLKDLNIHLFDPEETTAPVFEDADIPFELVRNEDSLADLEDAVVVIGEKTSFRDYGGLFTAMATAAARGIPVICLAPSAGEVTIAGGDNQPRMTAMIFRQEDIIADLNKRLDTGSWPPDGKSIASTVQLRGERGPVIGEISEGAKGWPWIEMGFGEGRRRLVLCGFGIIEKWRAGPTPRFLFAEILEHVVQREVKQDKGEGGEK